MVQWVEMLGCRLEELSSIPASHKVAGESSPESCPCTCVHLHAHSTCKSSDQT